MQTGQAKELASQAKSIRRHVREQLLRLTALKKNKRSRLESSSTSLKPVSKKSGLPENDPAASLYLMDPRHPEILESLPVAAYVTDAAGRITFYNEAAVALWGRRPVLGEDRWCGSWRIYTPDGTPLPHDCCPMAVALRENRAVRNVEAIVERPDGTRTHFMPHPTPLRDGSDNLIGAVNILLDLGPLHGHGTPAL
jgi:PAS domain-containing protein